MASLCAAYADFCSDLRDPNYGGDGTNRAAYHQLRVRAIAATGTLLETLEGQKLNQENTIHLDLLLILKVI